MAASRPHPVAIVIGQLSQGGSERQLYAFLAECDRSEWEPTVYVSGGLGYWEKPIRELGIPVMLLRGNPLTKMLQFRRAVRAQRATCFFSWSSYTNAYGLALFRIGVKRIGSFRNALFADLPGRLRWLWSWLSTAAVSIVVCNSREAHSQLVERVGTASQVVYVPNSVQTFPLEQILEWRKKWRTRLKIEDDVVMVLGVGRLTSQKRFDRFVSVVSEVRRQQPVRGVIAGGDHGCLSELQDQIAENNLTESVQLIGAVPDARELMCAADIFLMTSDYEGMPNVVLEAMSVGLPCISTKVNGVDELICHESTGFLASSDVDSLAAGVTRLASDPEMRRQIGSRAQRAITQMSSPAEIARRLWALCEPTYQAKSFSRCTPPSSSDNRPGRRPSPDKPVNEP